MKNLVSYKELYTLIGKSYSVLEWYAICFSARLAHTLKCEDLQIIPENVYAYMGGNFEESEGEKWLQNLVLVVNTNHFKSYFEMVTAINGHNESAYSNNKPVFKLDNTNKIVQIPYHLFLFNGDYISAPILPLILEYIFYKSKGVDVDTLEKQLFTRLSEMFVLPYGVDYVNQYGDNLGNLDECCEEKMHQLAING